MPVAGTVISPSNLPNQVSTNDPQGEIVFPLATSLGGFFGTSPITQPAGGGPNRGAFGVVTVYTSTQSPTLVTPNETAEKAMTVAGVAATDLPLIDKPTSQAGLFVASARASATNTIQVTFGNVTAATITPTASESYVITTIPVSLTKTISLAPAPVAATSIVEQQFPIPNVQPGMFVTFSKPTLQAGLAVLTSRVVSAGVVGITFINTTSGTLTPTTPETYVYYAGKEISPSPVMGLIQSQLAPTAVAANTTAEQTFTVTGLAAGAQVEVDKPSIQPGLGIGGARISAANTLAITFVNVTATTITPATETYTISYFPTASPAAGSSTATNGQAGIGATGALISLGLIAGP